MYLKIIHYILYLLLSYESNNGGSNDGKIQLTNDKFLKLIDAILLYHIISGEKSKRDLCRTRTTYGFL